MIKVNVFSEEKAWSKRLKNQSLFFKKVCRSFPKKYQFLNKKVSLNLLLSNNKKIKISKNTFLGDIIISYNYLDKPKSQELNLFKDKVIKIFIHGYLHLLGFDHIKDKDYSKMLRRENFLYNSVKLKID